MSAWTVHQAGCPAGRLSSVRPRTALVISSPASRSATAGHCTSWLIAHWQRGVSGTRCSLQRAARQTCRATESQASSGQESKSGDAVDELMQRVQDLAGPVREGLQGNSIYLVGMMGSGKSSVGKILARVLEYPFLDSDKLIEQLTKASVAEVFADCGEDYFRELESNVLKQLMPWKSTVVATGGGAVVKRENWALMQHAVVIWLHGKPSVLAHRAVADETSTRPLLSDVSQNGDSQSAVEATAQRLNVLLTERAAMYAQADICVPVDSPEPHAVAGAGAAEVVYRVLKGLQLRLQTTQQQREQQKQFHIDSVSGIPNANYLSPPG